MKTLHYSIIVFSIAGLLVGTSNSVYAPCLVGVTDCGPPPSVKVSISSDSQFYEKNDTINIQGQVYVQNYSKPIHIQVVNSDNATIRSIDAPIVNGKFGLQTRANFDTTGDYHIATCVQGWCDGWFFKFVAEPYKLTVNEQDFFIKYKSFADLVGMEADINSHALRVHIVNAMSQGEQFVIELPRALIDSKGYDGKDASFRVFLGMHQPDKYMQPANFTEIASNDLSRKLAINIPYEPVPNSSGMWDFKIIPADTVSGPSVNYESPLKQFKSGVNIGFITCKSELYFVLRSYDREPVCLKAGTISKLASRGFLFATSASNENYTTVIISPGSENQASPHTYSPDVVTVVLGVNNTIRWVNQADVANTIVPDMPLTQNGKSFGSDGVIKPDQSYTFTFTEPGTFAYHTEPHPWMKGSVIVTSNPMTNLKNNTGILTFENQTYYFDTPNYTKTSYVHPVQITFHDVNFTLFPPGFRGGLPVGGCPGQYYWVDAKFADGAAELLHIYAGSQSCADSVPVMLSNHILPQAGLTFSDGKMRLLVRDENQAGKDIVLQKPSSMEKPFPQCNSNPAKEKLIREKQQVLTDALLSEEKKYGGFENRTQNLPWSFIGYDCVDNALEVGILPQYFNSDFLPKYFEKIRSIVGNTIDIVLSPEDYALPL